ncbi:MAG TPA: MOSC N-terminal beta barrel domain-containing protein [Ktedonobacterales bacterium]
MPTHSGALVGHVKAIYRYPVKSMRGEPLDEAQLGLLGFAGDRRFAFIQTADRTGFPWLTGREYASLVRYAPTFTDPASPNKSAVRVRTPDGLDLPLESATLREHLEQASGRALHLLRLDYNRTYDIGDVSLFTTGTLAGLSALVGQDVGVRRFRPNIVVETPPDAGARPERDWVGRTLVIGEGDGAPRIRVTMNDLRCKMVDIDPETGAPQPGVLAAIVRELGGDAGVYGAIERPGMVIAGAPVSLIPL